MEHVLIIVGWVLCLMAAIVWTWGLLASCPIC